MRVCLQHCKSVLEKRGEISTTLTPLEKQCEISTTLTPLEKKDEISTTLTLLEKQGEISTTLTPLLLNVIPSDPIGAGSEVSSWNTLVN